MSNLFYRNPRLVILTIALILVAGLSSYYVLPRMEDPLLTQRAAMITTRFPGADAERVESLVTEKLEEALQEIDEIKEMRSVSRAGVSTVNIELRDDIYEVDSVWSRVRDKISDMEEELPDAARKPDFDEIEVKAYAMIVGLIWDQPSLFNDAGNGSPPNHAILRRLAEKLEDQLVAIPGTEQVDTFGDPEEEILVEVDPSAMTALGLTVDDLSKRIRASDAKVTAGQFRGRDDFLLEVSGELKTLDRIEQIPIHQDEDGRFVRLADIALIRKGIKQPQTTIAIVEGKPAIAFGALVRPSIRVDHWSSAANETLQEFRESLPSGIRLATVFQQNDFVESRLTGLLANLLLGGIAVTLVIFVMMGWRSAIIVASTLPLAALMVLFGMRLLEIPIHQMSVTGLIIALGLLIDNAIVIVDEVNDRLTAGATPASAVGESVSHLGIPLFGSTVTTALAFAPIALMPGPAGEFVGSIAVSVILAISSSLFLALTVVPAVAAYARPRQRDGRFDEMVPTFAQPSFERRAHGGHWWQIGLRLPRLLGTYERVLQAIFRRPAIGIMLGLLLPVAGLMQFTKLPEQFFPPGDRNQFQIELELPAQASLNETLRTVSAMREEILKHEKVEEVSWFVGQSAPSFYYNLIPRRRNTASYAQAFVQMKANEETLATIRELQSDLNAFAPGCRVLVRQLEQGPPFDAPVEVRLFGPDLDVLQDLGDQVRATLSQLANVVHTRSDLGETVANLSFQIDEEASQLAGLDHTMIANQLNRMLEGAVGGSVLEQTEELPVRVRVANDRRGQLDSITSLELVSPATSGLNQPNIPISALGRVVLEPQSASIPRLNRRRMNEVQAYVTAGILPATVVEAFEQRMRDSAFVLPNGYQMELGGEAAKRNDAVGDLMANVGMLLVMMIATLVLSFKSFRMAGIIGAIAMQSVGLGIGALWLMGYPFGFMAIVGTMGLIGVAINDSIVVLAAIRDDRLAREGDPGAVTQVVVRSTRHVVATTLTTIAGFIPLLLSGGGFWPPLAVSIAGGVGGATILALCFAPSAYIALMCRSCEQGARLNPQLAEDETLGHRGQTQGNPELVAV